MSVTGGKSGPRGRRRVKRARHRPASAAIQYLRRPCRTARGRCRGPSAPPSWRAGRGTPAPSTAAPRPRCWSARSSGCRTRTSWRSRGVTYELLRPVPIATFDVHAEIVRPGRRVQLLEGSIDRRVEAETVRERAGAASPPNRVPMPGGPRRRPHRAARPRPARARSRQRLPGRPKPMFATHAMEIRFVDGAFTEPGPATAWFRLRAPLIDGRGAPTPQQLAAAGRLRQRHQRRAPLGANTCSSTPI